MVAAESVGFRFEANPFITFAISMKVQRVESRGYNQSKRIRIAPLQLVIAQGIGSTVGMSLRVAMTASESDHSTEVHCSRQR